MGTSDIHGLIDWEHDIPAGGHRPVTLVFAEEKTENSIKKALENGRTAVWYKNLLIGKEEHVTPLIDACLSITEAKYKDESSVAQVTIFNDSDAEYILKNTGEYNFHTEGNILTLQPNTVNTVEVKVLQKSNCFQLKFNVLNAIIAPNEHPELVLDVAVG
jgi:hypothetical protein